MTRVLSDTAAEWRRTASLFPAAAASAGRNKEAASCRLKLIEDRRASAVLLQADIFFFTGSLSRGKENPLQIYGTIFSAVKSDFYTLRVS